MIATDRFDLYGVTVSVRSESAALRSVVEALLGPFAADLGDGAPDFQCHLTSDKAALPPEMSIPPGLEPRHTEMGSSYYVCGERSFLTAEGGATGMADTERRRLVLHIPSDFLADHAWCTQHNLLRLLLLELLRTRGIFPLHAAAAALGEVGVLVTAFGGGGKSTFSIALTRAGLHFLVDDVLLLRREGSEIAALYLPDEVELRPESLDFFPELAPLKSQPLNGHGKLSFVVPELFPGRTAERCIPRVILFPRLTRRPETHLEPLSSLDAWCRLLCQSLWSPDSEHGREHWELLGNLVEQCRVYDLALGTDLDAAARQVIDLLEEEQK